MNWIDKFTTDGTSTRGSSGVNSDFINATLHHPKYHAVMKTATHGVTTESEQHAWRTKSKAGLNWAISSGNHVHFILDDLNMKEVAEKTNTKGNPDQPQGKAPLGTLQKDKVRTITNAELRWIYRHKDHSDVKDLVHFWLADKPCCPPRYPAWDSGKGKKVSGDIAWQGYAPTHWYSGDLVTPD
jgi:hypothetical protein